MFKKREKLSTRADNYYGNQKKNKQTERWTDNKMKNKSAIKNNNIF